MIGKDAAPASMDPRWFLKPGEKLPEKIVFPTPTMPREVQQEQFVRDLEIDPKKYYPPHAYRKPVQKWPGVVLKAACFFVLPFVVSVTFFLMF